MLQLSQEMSGGSARLRVDVYGPNPVEYVLEDMNFLNYRLAEVNIEDNVTLAEPDIVWNQEGVKAISYDGTQMTFTGPWDAGPLQKVVVTMLALKMEAEGLHPFHSAAVNYKGKTMLFLGGESNHGKSMGLIEACRRGGLLVGQELRQLRRHIPHTDARVAAIYRRRSDGSRESILPEGDTVIRQHDIVFFIAARKDLRVMMSELRKLDEGLKNLGAYLVRMRRSLRRDGSGLLH